MAEQLSKSEMVQAFRSELAKCKGCFELSEVIEATRRRLQGRAKQLGKVFCEQAFQDSLFRLKNG